MIKIHLLFFTLLSLNIKSCKNPEVGDIYNYDSYENTPIAKLAKTVEKEDTASIRELVSKERMNINYQDPKFGMPILALAVVHSKSFCVEQLLKLGANPNLKSPKEEDDTPFHEFCNYSSDTVILKLLIKYGADVNASSDAIRKKYLPDYNTVNILNTTPLEALCMSSSLACVRILIDNGARLDTYPKDGEYSLISTATGNKDIDILRYLLIEKKVAIPYYVVIRQKGTPHEEKISLRQLILESRYDLSKDKHTIEVLNEILAFLKANGK
jgi:ankyrin repeat protein